MDRDNYVPWQLILWFNVVHDKAIPLEERYSPVLKKIESLLVEHYQETSMFFNEVKVLLFLCN
jgi:hypothetical protein